MADLLHGFITILTTPLFAVMILPGLLSESLPSIDRPGATLLESSVRLGAAFLCNTFPRPGAGQRRSICVTLLPRPQHPRHGRPS